MVQRILEERIAVDPNVCGGKPCIKGTRTPVYIILEALATGMNFDEVIKEFRPITKEDIQACIFYAALLADERELTGQAA